MADNTRPGSLPFRVACFKFISNSLVMGGVSLCFKLYLKYKSIFHQAGMKTKVFLLDSLPSRAREHPGPGFPEHIFPADPRYSQRYRTQSAHPTNHRWEK